VTFGLRGKEGAAMKPKMLLIFGAICCVEVVASVVSDAVQAQVHQYSNASAKCPKAPAGGLVEPLDTCVTDALSGGGLNLSGAYFVPPASGEEVFGNRVPYGTVWRTGGGGATIFTTATDINIGELAVPAGTYTLYSVPSPGIWQLIVSKQTNPWGEVYDETKDLGRVPMANDATPAERVDTFKIMFVSDRRRAWGYKVELHLVWSTTDVYVPIARQEPIKNE